MPDDAANLILEHTGHMRGKLVRINRRLDRLDERVGRMERRLELVKAWAPSA